MSDFSQAPAAAPSPASLPRTASGLRAFVLSLPGASAHASWLPALLRDGALPGSQADVTPHGTPRCKRTQAAIADAQLDPAAEACLHLMNRDLYSAHFLVRKAQGGARLLDWLHGTLHKLEGDARNAKMWYADCAAREARIRRSRQARDASGGADASDGPATPFGAFWRCAKEDGASAGSIAPLSAGAHADLIALQAAVERGRGSRGSTSKSARSDGAKGAFAHAHHAATTACDGADKVRRWAAPLSAEQLAHVEARWRGGEGAGAGASDAGAGADAGSSATNEGADAFLRTVLPADALALTRLELLYILAAALACPYDGAPPSRAPSQAPSKAHAHTQAQPTGWAPCSAAQALAAFARERGEGEDESEGDGEDDDGEEGQGDGEQQSRKDLARNMVLGSSGTRKF